MIPTALWKPGSGARKPRASGDDPRFEDDPDALAE